MHRTWYVRYPGDAKKEFFRDISARPRSLLPGGPAGHARGIRLPKKRSISPVITPASGDHGILPTRIPRKRSMSFILLSPPENDISSPGSFLCRAAKAEKAPTCQSFKPPSINLRSHLRNSSSLPSRKTPKSMTTASRPRSRQEPTSGKQGGDARHAARIPAEDPARVPLGGSRR